MADPATSAPQAAALAQTPAAGLSSAEAAERRSRGGPNAAGEHTSRSVAEILRANILTRFNFILGVLLAVILAVGEPQDALFGIVLVTNALIGIAQELRAKRTLDRLAVLSAPKVRVIRDGMPRDLDVADLVGGDLVDLRPGDQLVADGIVRASMSLQADESLLTGESEPVDKKPVTGCCRAASWWPGRAVIRPPGWAPRPTRASWRTRRGGSRWSARS
jgi:cation-transporting ATPase E